MPSWQNHKKLIFTLTVIILFFCLVPLRIYAAAPTLGAISPASGSTLPEVTRTFTCTYTDTDGWANLKESYLLISTSSTTLTNAAYLYYDQNTNLLYLRNDANTIWLGGYAPGSANTIENSYVRLNCVSTTATGSVSTLTISWNLSFKPAYSGKRYNTYLSVKDDTGGLVGLTYKGTYTVNYSPTVGAIAPSLGTGQVNVSQNFTATYTDTDGWQNIQYVRLLINSSTGGTNCFYGYYNQNTNLLYLRNDANTSWLGGYAPGSSNVIENSYAKLDCSQTSVSGTGTIMTVNWRLILKTPFTGTKNTYLYVADDLNAYQGWIKKGTWSIPNNAPGLGSISPSLGGSIPDYTFSFSTTYTDPDGWQNIGSGYLLINSSTSGANCFYGYYNQNTNKFYLRNDANTAWLGGYAPGSSYTIENSYVKLILSQSSILGQGNTLTVNWAISFKPIFLGDKNCYLYVKDDVGSYVGLTKKGSWSAFSQGTVISSPGGEIATPDGKIKLNIPSGSLTYPTAISISNVDTTNLQNTIPTNTSLLSVVECLPYGLTFNTPTAITYSLGSAEVPGTPVSLGLYDKNTNQIVSTGQASSVEADGYRVNFSLEHFSTYAALKNLVSQGAAIGAWVKIPLPDMLTGSFSTGIPITVVPGRKGLQPALGLSYRSSNPNSWIGLGFSLSPGYIVRSTRLGPPTYNDTQDTFYFVTDTGTTELVYLIDNLYQAKIESGFTKFYKETNDSWKALAKDGSILQFGQSPDAREALSSGSFSWYLTKAVDTNGNYLSYSYTKDQGKSYLSRIDYTGNEMGIGPANSVEFILEPRSDVSSSYISGARITTAKRLKEIIVKLNLELVFRYVLEYVYSPDTNRSLLQSVTQYSADGKSLPVQRFKYQEGK